VLTAPQDPAATAGDQVKAGHYDEAPGRRWMTMNDLLAPIFRATPHARPSHFLPVLCRFPRASRRESPRMLTVMPRFAA
jgi:hypothetical protein